MTCNNAFAVILLMALAAAHALEQRAHAAGCPDISGRYKPVGSGDVVVDALKALRIGSVVLQGSELRLEGRPEDGLRVWLTTGGSAVPPSRPTVVLAHGTDFTCEYGRLVFSRVPGTQRKTDQGWSEGASVVRIGPVTGGALGIEVTFTGGERTNLFSYDSARISMPKPGTRTTLREALRWPSASEFEKLAPAAPAPEPRDVSKVRAMFDAKLLGNVMLNTLQAGGDAVLVTLTARRNDDVARLEDRLRAASIRHDMKEPPTWTGNGYYVQLRVWASGTGAANRPSAYRVQQELQRVRHPMVRVRKVEDAGDGYVATLGVHGSDKVESIIALLKANTDMFADIRLVSESPSAEASKPRLALIKLRLR